MKPEKVLDALLSLPSIDDYLWLQVSRDGRWVVWTWFNTGPVADVFVAQFNGSSCVVESNGKNVHRWLLVQCLSQI
jgi:hypothetical protein